MAKPPAPQPAAPAPPPLIPGRIVHYKLSLRDVMTIQEQRFANPYTGDGTAPKEGDVLPMIVVSVPRADIHPHLVNGQVILDGNDALWVRAAREGKAVGEWSWPRR